VRIEQHESLATGPEHWIVNVRVSKMGGLVRSLSVVARARELGLSIVVGAQVGETSVLAYSTPAPWRLGSGPAGGWTCASPVR
jgi:hypothetical protein